MQKAGYYVKKKGSLVSSLHILALVLSPKHNIHYLERVINIFSQVDLVFPKTVSSFLVPRLHAHSAVGIPLMTLKKRAD